MSESRNIPILRILAAVFWLLGMAWSVRTWQRLGDAQRRLRDRQIQLESLRNFAGEHAEYADLQKRAQDLAAGDLKGLADLLDRQDSKLRPADNRERVEPLGDGWAWYNRELVFEDAPVASVMGLIDEAERLHPPWRMRSCEIRASAHTPGNGHVSVVLGVLQPAR